MTLADVMAQLDSFDDDLTIYAEQNPDWSANSLAVVLPEPEEGGVPDGAQGMSYLLEVFLAKEAIEVWSGWRAGRKPTVRDKCEAVIHYAEQDAYLPD